MCTQKTTWIETNIQHVLAAISPDRLLAFLDMPKPSRLEIVIEPTGVGIWEKIMVDPRISERLENLRRQSVTIDVRKLGDSEIALVLESNSMSSKPATAKTA